MVIYAEMIHYEHMGVGTGAGLMGAVGFLMTRNTDD
jgi:hypothetical protein